MGTKRKNPNAGLFTGWWYKPDGTKLRRIRRDEYPELYRLHRQHTAIRLGVTVLGTKANYGSLSEGGTSAQQEDEIPTVSPPSESVLAKANYGALSEGGTPPVTSVPGKAVSVGTLPPSESVLAKADYGE